MIHRSRRIDFAVGIKGGIVPGLRVVNMNSHDRRWATFRGRHKLSKNIVDAALTITRNIACSLQIGDRTVIANRRTLYDNHPGKGRIGYGSKKDSAYILAPTAWQSRCISKNG